MTVGDVGLLDPGRARAGGITDDAALVAAMLKVESAWAAALAAAGATSAELAEVVRAAANALQPEIEALALDAESIGNAVLPVVNRLREAVGSGEAKSAIHRGLTSQDVLDTALMLVTREALNSISADLREAASQLAALADTHRHTVMAGRTLTQHAVPITFGLKAAHWLLGVLDAMDSVARAELPVQAGGAAGTLALAATLVDPQGSAGAATAGAAAPAGAAGPAGAAEKMVQVFADELGLAVPVAPWHTRRTPITTTADAMVGVTDALGVIGGNVALLSRPEIAELGEGGNRGGSSTMPHKHNPVLSVLLRSTALQAPMLAATVHVAAGQSVDERPDGAWHAEWAAYRRLLTLTVVAASQAAELLGDLVVDADAMQQRVRAHADDLLAERFGVGEVPADADPAEYLGANDAFIDAALERAAAAGIEPPVETARNAPELAFTLLAGDAACPEVLIVGAGLGTAVTTLWQDAAKLLGERFEVVGVDLPGHGASPAATAPFTVADLADAVRAKAQEIANGRPIWYAGVSLAGAVALQLATSPGPFHGVAAIASATKLGDPTAWAERAELVRRAGTPVMISGSAQRWFGPDFAEREPDTMGQMLHDLSNTDDASYALCCEALAAYDLSGATSSMAGVPVLLAPGEHDGVVTVERAEQDAAALPASSLHVIADAAHQPPVENPAMLAAALVEFIDQHHDATTTQEPA